MRGCAICLYHVTDVTANRQRLFFRHASPKHLEIHKVFLRCFDLPDKKISRRRLRCSIGYMVLFLLRFKFLDIEVYRAVFHFVFWEYDKIWKSSFLYVLKGTNLRNDCLIMRRSRKSG
jgi:hypothetical protein